MDENRRRRSRVSTHFLAAFTPQAGQAVPLVTKNISMKGLLAEPEGVLASGETGRMRLTLSSEAVIDIDCRVIRSDATGVAIDFLPMDEESFTHLRNIVRYNAPDADTIDSELRIPAFED